MTQERNVNIGRREARDALRQRVIPGMYAGLDYPAASMLAQAICGEGWRTGNTSNATSHLVELMKIVNQVEPFGATSQPTVVADENGWSPIDTAPRDVTIDLWTDRFGHIDCCWWFKGKWWTHNGQPVEEINDPTHWRRRPGPPVRVSA